MNNKCIVFQLVSIAEYQAHQIQMNLPSHSLSDDESDTSFVGDQDLTYSVGMIYYSKVISLSQCQRPKIGQLLIALYYDCIMQLKIFINLYLSQFIHTVFIVIDSSLQYRNSVSPVFKKSS